MAGKQLSTGFEIPEVEADHPLPIENTIGALRKDIDSRCNRLLQCARTIDSSEHGAAFRLKFWETRIAQVKQAKTETFSIDELRRLRKECETLSAELERFRLGAAKEEI